MRLYIKLFVVVGLSTYILLTIMLPIVTSDAELFSIIGGLSIGIIVAAILGNLHLKAVTKLPLHSINDAYKVRHSQRVELHQSYVSCFELCIDSVASLINSKVISSDKQQGRIVVIISKSGEIWGERIDFQIEKQDTNSCSVLVSSKPIIFTVMIDCGRNFTHVNTIINCLKDNEQIAEKN